MAPLPPLKLHFRYIFSTPNTWPTIPLREPSIWQYTATFPRGAYDPPETFGPHKIIVANPRRCYDATQWSRIRKVHSAMVASTPHFCSTEQDKLRYAKTFLTAYVMTQ
jgi:hypothetical protein